MSKELIFLGIESSCDETAASIVKEDKKGNVTILSNIVSSQIEEHKPFGGVVPELAARSHVEKIDTIIKKAVQKSGVVLENINVFCVPMIIITSLSISLSSTKTI